jgi:hypothetical protein
MLAMLRLTGADAEMFSARVPMSERQESSEGSEPGSPLSYVSDGWPVLELLGACVLPRNEVVFTALPHRRSSPSPSHEGP